VPARRKAKKKSSPRRKRKTKKIPPLSNISVGDAVRLALNTHNQIARYDPHVTQRARGSGAIEGIVVAIRDIGSGKLKPKTRGDLSKYVFEIIHNRTFQRDFASDRNSGGPRGPNNVRNNPTWQRVQNAVQEMAGKKQLFTIASGGMIEEPIASLLDGWQVVKVRVDSMLPL